MKKEQKIRLAILIVLYAAYLAAGILLAVTNSHCRADLPLYIIGAVLATICVITTFVYEAKLAKHNAK